MIRRPELKSLHLLFRRTFACSLLPIAAAACVLVVLCATPGPAADSPPAIAADTPADDNPGPPGPPPRQRRNADGPPRDDQPGPRARSPRDSDGPPRDDQFGPRARSPRDADGPPRDDQFGPRFGGGRQPGPPPLAGPPRRPFEDPATLEKNDPELFKLVKKENELDRNSREHVAKYQQAAKADRSKIKEDLQKVITEQFEARQQRRALELKRFEDELKRLRESMDNREKNRKQIIEKRVSDLLGPDADSGF
jgi:hypothetical protein